MTPSLRVSFCPQPEQTPFCDDVEEAIVTANQSGHNLSLITHNAGSFSSDAYELPG